MSFCHFKKSILMPTLSIFIVMWVPQNASEESGTHIRTLASSCVTCHGVQFGTQSVIPSLAGLDVDYFINKMKAYRSSDKEHDVMVQHAKGLTELEIEQLATLFSQQYRGCNYNKKQSVNRLMEE